MIENKKENLEISGTGVADGGCYHEVELSGAAYVNGDLFCDSLDCSGASRIQGNVECTEDMDCSGSFRCSGNIRAGDLDTSGFFACEGNVTVKNLDCAGNFQAAGEIQAEDLDCSGSLNASQVRCKDMDVSGGLKVESNVEAETCTLEGTATIPGLLNAEEIEITASPETTIGDIGGSKITVSAPRRSSVIIECGAVKIFVKTGKKEPEEGVNGNMTVHSIEGDEINLELVTADVVRGRSVTIGTGCKIRRVEYSESFHAEEGTVEEAVKME